MMYSTKALRPGMVLQDPVRDPRGQVLLPAGMELKDVHIAQLLQRGIAAAAVCAQETEEEREERVARERERVARLFGEAELGADLEQLRRLVLERIDAG